jgi:hypothetical protein
VATGRLALTAQGLVRYTLKTPYRDGTTHVIFEPLDFIARLAALVPKPRVHLTRFHAAHPCAAPLRGSLRLCKSAVLPICHGVFAPHSALRAQVTPAGRGQKTGVSGSARSPAERHRAMTWAQRLKRVFRIDIEQCERCGGKVRIIASIEDPQVIGRILAHLEPTEQARGSPADLTSAHRARGPPGQGQFDLR